MNRMEFISALVDRLESLPIEEIEKSLAYYSELIDDKVEDGMSETEAVESLGSMDEIVKNIMYDMPITKLVKAKVNESKNKASNKTVWLALILLGSPMWIPLLIGFVSILFGIYITIWSIIISLFAVIFSLGIVGIFGTIVGVAYIFLKTPAIGICVIGMAVSSAGIMLFMIYPIKWMTAQLIKLTAYVLRKVKSIFIKESKV